MSKHRDVPLVGRGWRALCSAVPLFLILATMIIVPPVAIAQEAPSTGATGSTTTPPPATGPSGASGPTGTTAPVGPPSITSDKADYAPGEQVTLTGAGWADGEGVHIVVNDTLGQTWKHTADVNADSAGAFTDVFNLPNIFVSDYDVTATGLISGTATTTFTDAVNPSADTSQCNNGGVGPPTVLDECRGGQPPEGGTFLGDKNYVAGNANGSKAHWKEGEFVAYRSVIQHIASGPHNYTIHWDTVSSGKHALDYIGSFDATEKAFHATTNAIGCDEGDLPDVNGPGDGRLLHRALAPSPAR
jgi:hypothetical protein